MKQRIVELANLILSKSKLSTYIWLALVVLGIFSYTTLLNREGFPAIQFPTGLVQGSYIAGDQSVVDRDITQPISEELLKDELVESIQSTAGDNFFSIFATYDQSLTNDQAAERFKNSIESNNLIPDTAQANFINIDPAAYLGEYNVLLSVYGSQNSRALQDSAQLIADRAEQELNIDSATVITQVQELQNPLTGLNEQRKTNFSRIALNQSGDLVQYNSVLIGLDAPDGFNVVDFSEEVAKFANSSSSDDVQVTVGADFGPAIKQQINNLQSNVISGLLVVVFVSFLLISWRSSMVTAIFIGSVLLVTFVVMLIVGITINTISLFALVLALGLFVDDATIVVEAIEASRRKKQPIEQALRKVATASISGTLTTVLVFLPLTFVGGVLGEFIRILPLTLIIALLVSLALSLTLIPLLASQIILGKKAVPSPLNKAEESIARGLSRLILKVKNKGGTLLALAMVTVSFVFILGSFYFASQLKFNIFPPAKDADEIQVTINYLPGTTIEQAELIAEEVNSEFEKVAGDNFERAIYYDANERSAVNFVELISYRDRDITSVQILEEFEEFTDKYKKANVRAAQVDGGPPSSEFPFQVQIYGEIGQAEQLAKTIRARLQGSTIDLASQDALVTETRISGLESTIRRDGEAYVQVEAAFDSDEVTALVQGAKELVEEEYGEQSEQQGLRLEFDFGQESENQESFNSLAIVGPLSLLAMFVLLAFQFKSLLLPLLIFTAIPFSFFGVFAGLYYTNNPIGFFTLIGFLGLIGIAVNNTILLVDYANQELAAGKKLVQAVAEATKKRFRPLITTSLTTVAALLPLALSDPFWEALAFTIIFGLLSSTLLVVVSFPYYYLLAQKIRSRVLKKKELV